MAGVTIKIEGWTQIQKWMDAMGKRASREAILPIMKAAAEPLVGLERGNIRSISGALSSSLKVRSGKGDRPGVVSVYIQPSATAKQLTRIWSASPRKQHHQFAQRASESTHRRYSVFYGHFVESGHKIVRKGRVVGRAEPVRFAQRAADAGGDEAGNQIIENILSEILGE